MRPKIKYKTRKQRNFSPAQKIIIAKELFQGVPVKAVAQDWHCSEETVYRIQAYYIEYIRVWRVSCKNFVMCTYPLCKCGVDSRPIRK